MERINKVMLNGIEYAITDSEARQIAALLDKKVANLETATADIKDEMVELRLENQQLKNTLEWRKL